LEAARWIELMLGKRRQATARQAISEADLTEVLIRETSRALGRADTQFIGEKIAYWRRTGEPNWDAGIGIASPTLLRAFALALLHARKRYNLD
jgi:hypothetical protein